MMPWYGWVGLAMTLISVCLSWNLTGVRTHLLFFPQWMGYGFVVQALVERRTGSCFLKRKPLGYGLLFLVSIPVWWIFEGLNLFTGNWYYVGRAAFTDLEFFLFSSVSFSTVIPAVFGTAELLGTFSWTDRLRGLGSFPLRSRTLWWLHWSGWVMLLLMIIFPRVFFPFMWISIFLILDTLNARMGNRSLILELSGGNVRPLVLYGLGALVCGFFWEMWNIFAYPKWVYDIPYLDGLHVFEMPLAGYGGYIPFGWELFAMCSLIRCKGSGFGLGQR